MRSVLRFELDTAALNRCLQAASSSMKKSTVDPVPTPITASASSKGRICCTAWRATFCLSSSCVNISVSCEKFGVSGVGKTDGGPVTIHQHRPLDQGRMFRDQGQPLIIVRRLLLFIGKAAP